MNRRLCSGVVPGQDCVVGVAHLRRRAQFLGIVATESVVRIAGVARVASRLPIVGAGAVCTTGLAVLRIRTT